MLDNISCFVGLPASSVFTFLLHSDEEDIDEDNAGKKVFI